MSAQTPVPEDLQAGLYAQEDMPADLAMSQVIADNIPQLQAQIQQISLTLKNTGIEHPVLIDVTTGQISPVEWKGGTTDVIESVPVRDSIMAIAGASYFDWSVIPEAPSSLSLVHRGASIKLSWDVHGGGPVAVLVERRIQDLTGGVALWDQVAKLPASRKGYTDSVSAQGKRVSYRVKAVNGAGSSAYSNVASARF